MPDFSTTTNEDKVVASILMMGAMQKYFTYKIRFCCGVPSVTLLGDRADWESILNRLEKKPQLGPEPAQFYTLLKPVLTNFVSSFDSPSAPSIVDFWQRIADINGGSGYCHTSGWIAAFCFWDEDGKSLYAPRGVPPSTSYQINGRDYRTSAREVNGVVYHFVDTENIPAGYASVPVEVDDNGIHYDTIMVAGSVGIRVTSSGEALDEGKDHSGVTIKRHNRKKRNERKGDDDMEWEPYVYACANPTGEPGLDSLQPVSGWWIYVTEGQQAGDEEIEELAKKNGEDEALKVGNGDKKREEKEDILPSMPTKAKKVAATRA